MGREVRMVPADWQHPIEWRKGWRTGHPEIRFKPLHEGPYSERVKEWDEESVQWEAGFTKDYANGGHEPKRPDQDYPYSEYAGDRPLAEEYMPEFAPGTATHFMMYEDTSEGTPISPAFATPEELARWLADNNASTFGDGTGTYEQWLPICKGGWAPSMVMDANGLRSGVEFMAEKKPIIKETS